MDLEIGLDLDIDEYELTNFSNQQSPAPTSELGDAGSPSSSLLNEDLIQSNNNNIILKQCNTINNTSNNVFADSSFPAFLENEIVLPSEDNRYITNSKRGPGRPRKENSLISFRASNKQQLQHTKKKISGQSLFNTFTFENSNMGFAEELSTTANKPLIMSNDELPYFTERYPGKICSLCNLCERSSLGQGDMLKITVNYETIKNALGASKDFVNTSHEANADVCSENNLRKKTIRSKVTINNECVNELDIVGHDEIPTLDNIVFENSFVYIHSMCAMWAMQMKRIEEDFVPNFEEMIAKSVTRKCSFCLRYGASINCRMSCQKNYHLPCAAATGCFLIIESFQAFCVDHISQVPYIAVDTNIECRHCSSLGDISKLIMCSSCGAHYHNNCIGLANFPDSRSGWCCSQCCKCLICRQTENNENRSVKCEQCQKLYHTTCLRPTISSVPKYGWKCNRCRICSDCGARTPGAGASSRWHCHYTICDSCYQQRNKGFSCPICHKAYRAASHKEMVKCNKCNKFVHSTCDDEADLTGYHARKETNAEYEYVCQPCKSGKHLMTFATADAFPTTIDGFPRDLEAEFFDKDSGSDFTNMVDPLKISRKRISLKEINRGGKIGKLFMGKGFLNQFNRKRSVRGKGRQLLMLNSSSAPLTSSDLSSSQCSEEDMSLEKKMILCSAKDNFILLQDTCVMCGSLGTDQEACLIGCVQCGQCYHPHCANVTLSKTMLQKGWRCLDCTVCEGCGQKNDEGRLILCDECDISYHIYCMNPPLDAVPNGNWKCKWCAICQKCGRNSPGKNSSWFNGFLECGPCASQTNCFVCCQSYNENELIIQCSNCERWLHGLCDNIKNEEDAKAFIDIDYHCKTCRKDIVAVKVPPLKMPQGEKIIQKEPVNVKQTTVETHQEINNLTTANSANNSTPNETFETVSNTFWMDGVCVSEQGFNMIRSLSTEIKKKRKLRAEIIQKDSAVVSSLDSGIGGNSTPTPGEGANEGNITPTPTYKDGMVWLGEDGSQPEGFSISTNEEGLNILRKKRQRNLQKLGVGGFNVRMRGIRKENEELYMGSLENPSLTEEKKKKIIKKKLKSKLCESYPPYLQEAFFGKALLDNKDSSRISFGESDESETGICFSNDNFKTIIKETIPNTQSIQHVSENKSNIHKRVVSKPFVPKTSTTSLETEQSELSNNMQRNVLISASKMEETLKTLKTEDIVANMPTEFVPASTNNIGLSTVKMEMGQFNVNMMQNNNINMQQMPQSNNHTTQQNCMSGNMNMNNTQQLQQQQIHQLQHQQVQHHHQQVQHQQQLQQQRMQYQQTPYGTINSQNKHPSQYLTQKSDDPMLSQVKIESDLMLPQASAVSVSNDSQELTPQYEETVKEASVAGTQKTAEKMRRDEELGDMATISAVLYANTQHPELKILYPIWNDRCKVILKKWRSLSAEMKAPFLQQAKDNRSILRMRRSQQEPEKIYFQQKSLKEQEQERVWKQHQAKNKETYSIKPNKNAFVGDYPRSETSASNTSNNPINKLSQQSIFDLNLFNENNAQQNKLQANMLGTVSGNNISSIIPNQLTCDTKSLSQIDQQEDAFMTTLNQTIQHHNAQPTLDTVSKVFDANKVDSALQLSERNDIFLTDKSWPSASKLSESKDPMTSGVEKLEADENAGLGDILGGFADGDDDDILKSLTAEIGDDFNILEYADPELDEFNGSQNLLNKLDFDENQKAI